MPALFTTKEIGQQIEDCLNEIEAINSFAGDKSRELTDDESQRQRDLLGKVKQLEPRLKEAAEFEKYRAKAAPGDPVHNVVEQTHIRPVKSFNEPQWEVPFNLRGRTFDRMQCFGGKFAVENAYAAGMQLMAMLGYEHGEDFCREYGIRYTASKGVVFNAQTEGTTSQGGFPVPDPRPAAVIEYLERVGLAYRVCDVVPMVADTLNEAKISSGQTVYYPGEATAITASDLVFAQVALSVVKRATLTKVSSELVADSIVGIVDRVARRAGYQIALQNDNELINGNGSGTYGGETGLNTAVESAGIITQGTGNTWATITVGDIEDVVALLPDEHHEGASWIVSRAFFHSVMEKLLLAQGGSTAAEGSAGIARQVLGYPVNFSSQMPTTTAVATKSAYFGNFINGVMLGDRQQIEVATSDQYAFDEDVTTVRVTQRIDINVHEASSGSAAKAIVALKTGA